MSELTRKKNEASEIMFAMVDSATPANLKSGLTVTDDPYYKDGAGAWTALTIADAATEIGSTGMYTIEMTAAELNHDLILIKLTSAGAADTIVVIRTTTHDIDDVNTVVPDAAGVAPTVVEIRQEMDTNSIKMAPSQVLDDYKADVTNLDVAISTRNDITPPTVTEIRAEMEGAGYFLDLIKDDTQDLQTQIGTAGAGLGDLGGMSTSMMGEVQTKVNDALTGLNLDHLIKDPVDTSFANTVHLDSALGHMVGVGGSATFDRTTDSQEAIRNRGDDAWTTGGAGSISEILNVQALIPNSIDLANTATVRMALGLTNTVDDLPSTAEITPGTITIDHKAIGATSWNTVVNAAACSELAGLVYYDEVFDTATGYAAGDSIRITFKSQKITVDANDFEITGTDGWTFQTHIREAMRGTDLAALAATWTDEKAAFLDHSIATTQADLDTITGSDGVTLATQQLNYAPNTVIPDAMGTAAGLHATTDGKVDAVQTDTTAIKAKTDALPSGIAKNVALSGFNTFMVLSSDHVSAAIGKTVTGTISKDGGTFNALTNSVTEIGSGMYKVDVTQSEMDADVVTLKFVAADCDARIITIYTS